MDYWSGANGPVDSLVVADAIANAIKEENPGIVFAGQKSSMTMRGTLHQWLQKFLGYPNVQVVSKVEFKDDSTLTMARDVESGMVEVVEVSTPMIVLGAHKNLNTPRFPNLPGIMKAKRKPLAEKNISDLSSLAATVQNVKYSLPPEKAPGKVFKGKPVEEMVHEVVQLLRNEAKVI